MEKSKIDIEHPITRCKGIKSYRFKDRKFFTLFGARRYRADYIIFNYSTVKKYRKEPIIKL